MRGEVEGVRGHSRNHFDDGDDYLVYAYLSLSKVLISFGLDSSDNLMTCEEGSNFALPSVTRARCFSIGTKLST